MIQFHVPSCLSFESYRIVRTQLITFPCSFDAQSSFPFKPSSSSAFSSSRRIKIGPKEVERQTRLWLMNIISIPKSILHFIHHSNAELTLCCSDGMVGIRINWKVISFPNRKQNKTEKRYAEVNIVRFVVRVRLPNASINRKIKKSKIQQQSSQNWNNWKTHHHHVCVSLSWKWRSY